ncbi:hypothetical protein Pla52o_33960 [Novipirellula galeiformis]|uniref:Uncharacterized protein n=1 Tax=Novipirellula galeiformis TaxID=2528004 RepID=A0A5C6CCL5_9BACT|nr:hypothetical protein [Novipirellula galeiformis]TWU22340.1 hypothetical protein Pla52o_33960 [Novipirellula galeiformis]
MTEFCETVLLQLAYPSRTRLPNFQRPMFFGGDILIRMQACDSIPKKTLCLWDRQRLGWPMQLGVRSPRGLALRREATEYSTANRVLSAIQSSS